MKKVEIVLSALMLTLLVISCTDESKPVEEKKDTGELDTTAFLTQIKTLDSIMSAGVPEKKDIKKAIVLYQDYADYFPEDPKAPSYLFQVSDFYLNMGKVKKSVNTLTTIIEKYPDYKKIETVLFTRASHVDLDLRDTTLAKKYYEDFLEKYPESEYADDAKTRYENVGLSMEDIIKKFEEANASK